MQALSMGSDVSPCILRPRSLLPRVADSPRPGLPTHIYWAEYSPTRCLLLAWSIPAWIDHHGGHHTPAPGPAPWDRHCAQ